jgi:predicted ArsR family transcriptional regulator
MLDQRFLTSTRGRIVDLIRRRSRTVEELATELELTDNAVRVHLDALEQSGLVRSAGVRRDGTVGKPATIYELAPDADAAFSRAYVPFLSTLLTALDERLSTRELRAVMRDVGARLSAGADLHGVSLDARVRAASRTLDELGGATRVERHDDGATLVIQGCGCPLSAVVKDHDAVCLAVQTMLAELTDAEVTEHCDRGERPRCRFEFRAR